MKRHHRLHELSFHLVLISNGIESLTNFQFVAAISPPILPTLKHLCRRPFIRNLGTFAVNIIKPSTIHPPSSHRFSIPSTLVLDREREREREREGAPVRLHRPAVATLCPDLRTRRSPLLLASVNAPLQVFEITGEPAELVQWTFYLHA